MIIEDTPIVQCRCSNSRTKSQGVNALAVDQHF